MYIYIYIYIYIYTYDLTDNELGFRDMDLPKVSTEHDQRI